MVDAKKPKAEDHVPPANWQRQATAYFFAALAAALTLILRLHFNHWIGDNRPFLVVFFLPIIFSAYLGGLGPGLLATAVSAVGADYYLIPQLHSFSFARAVDFAQWLIFVLGGVLASGLCEMLHRSRRKADANWNLYAVTLASIGDGVITTDKSGRVTFLNPEAEKLTGWKNADAKGKELTEVFRIINEETRAPVENPVKKVLRTGMVAGLANHTVLISKDGTERSIDDSGAPIHTADGQIIGVVLVFRDITEKKRADDFLHREERFLENAGRIAKVGGWEFDPATGQGSWTEEVARIHDLDPAVQPNKEFGLSFYTPASRPKIERAVKMAIESGTPYDLELEFISAKGNHKWVRTIGQPVLENGKVVRVCGAIQDVTEQKRAESVQMRLAELVHSMNEACFFLDKDWRFYFVNDRCETLFKLRPAEMLGHSIWEVFSRLVGTPMEKNYRRAMAERVQVNFEAFSPIAQSWLDIRLYPFGDGLAVFLLDIGDRKKTESLLSQQKAVLEMIADDAPLPAVLEKLIRAIESQDPNLIGSILLLDRATKKLRHGAAPSLPEKYNQAIDGVEIGEGVGSCGTAAFLGQPVIVGDIQTDPLWKNFCGLAKEFGLAACWSTPIFNPQHKVLGTFAIYQRQTGLPTESHLHLIELITHIAALAINREQTADALRTQRRELDYIINNTKEVIFQIDLQGNYIFGNAAAEKLTGYPLAELLKMNMMQIVAPEYRSFVTERLRKRIANEPMQSNFEFEIVQQSGSRAWTELATSAVLDASGKLTAIQGVARDVTQRKQGEAQRANLAAIVQNSEDAIISKNLDGIITSWNRGAEKVYGYTAAEAVGQPLLIIFPADKLPEEQQILTRILRGETIENFETVRIRKDGRQINVSVTISPMRDANGQIIGASKIARDITEKQRLEEQLRHSQKMEAIGQLAGGVAHDFNNLLTAIHGNAALLTDPTLAQSEHQECVSEIFHAANRAADLTRQLLLFSRKQTLLFTNLDLNNIVTNSTRMLRRILGEDVTLQTEFAPGQFVINADAGMVEQIILNLAVNARDAMPHGGTLTIRTSCGPARPPIAPPTHAPEPHICLSVTDTGCGIAPEILPRIFEPFFTTKEVGKGTGLGLATIYGIVQQHNGWITAESAVGRGTTFHVYFPVAGTEHPEKPAEQIDVAMPVGHETILVVEDEPPVRQFTSKLLKRLGYQILVAGNGTEALTLWSQHRDTVALVLTDIVMPGGMKGFDLAEQLRIQKPAQKIIFTSGYASDADPRSALLFEGDNFIRKPFSASALAEIVRRCLDAENV